MGNHNKLCNTSLHDVHYPHSGSTRSLTVEDQVHYLECKFRILTDQAYKEVTATMEPSIFLFRITCIPVLAHSLHRTFIKEELTNIPPPLTFQNIWTKLNLYWDILNYGLLEHVINVFGSDELKQQMQDYVHELSTFKQRTRLCDFIETWPCRDEGLPEDRLKKLVVKMGKEWSQCTLQDLESFNKKLVHKFFLPEFDILLQTAVRALEKYKSEDHYLSICEQVMCGYGQMDQTVVHCIFVGPAGVGKSSLMNRLLHKQLQERTSTPVAEKSVQVKIIRDVSTAVVQVSYLQWQVLEDPDTQASELIRQLSTEPKNYAALTEQVSKQTQASGQLPAKEKDNHSTVEGVSTELAIGEGVPFSQVTTTVEREVPEQTEVVKQESESDGTQTQTPGELLSTQSTSKGQSSKPLSFFRRVLKEKGISEIKQYIKNPWTLYLTDSGGQPEFHELIPALVVGPSVFFVVFRLDQDLNEKYEVEYVRSDKKIHKSISSLTVQEDLMRTLASIASTKYLDISGKEVKPKVILVATFKDKVPHEEDCQRKLQQIQDLVQETDVFRDGMIVDASETQMVFTINNISDEEAEIDAQKIRHAIQKLVMTLRSPLLPRGWFLTY